ncbi:hypothetical protein ABPG72_016894 [Tetrahymena utriculariae]
MASKKDDFLYKIIMVGDPRVGKTSFLIRYIKGVLPKSPMPTIGVEYLSKQVLLSGGEGIVKAQIWDMSIYRDSVENGQEYKPQPPESEGGKTIIIKRGDLEEPKQPNDCCCN